MFKLSNFEQELAETMQEHLVSNQLDNKYSFDRIAKAIDLLHSAADIFDDTGFHVEAEVITRMLEKLAKKKVNEPVVKEAQISLGDLTPDEMKWYQGLPRHTKDLLESHLKRSEGGYQIDVGDFVREVKLLYKIRKAQEPEVLEFESLMHGPVDPYGDTVDITSLMGKKKV